jgi:hypothetical protein
MDESSAIQQCVPFLKRTAEDLFERHREDIGSLTLVFPNRRARLFFFDYLSPLASRPIEQPKVVGIDEIFSRISGLSETNRYALVASLYECYKKFQKADESFDHFYLWGEVMLDDFDLLDKYLVPVDPLLKNLAALKNTDSDLSFLTKEQYAAIRAFWENFSLEKSSHQLQEKFASVWDMLLPTYNDFQQALAKKNHAYQGMIYRKGAEMLQSNSYDFEKDKYVFIGFNALNKCEKVLLHYLKNNDRAEFYWDYDEYYINDKRQEAGLFMRDNLHEFPSGATPRSLHSCFTQPKDIQIIAVPSDVLQAKLLPTLLNEICEGQPPDGRTAIVLADENLLIPTLYSLPKDTPMLNVTMGYPLSQTPAYSLIEIIVRLQQNARTVDNQPVKFYHKDVLSLLQHQYIRTIADRAASALCSHIIEQNCIYVTANNLAKERQAQLPPAIHRIFEKADTPNDFIDMLSDVLKKVAADHPTQSSVDASLRYDYVVYIYKQLNLLASPLRENNLPMSTSVFLNILCGILRSVRIPFEGEPIAGLQLMGILESRVLDFDNVIMLSLNEDIFPRTEATPSFIPYNLRRGFGLPTVEQHEAMYAYYFYRLLQRSKRVRLVYNSQSSDSRTGEMNRYLRQLQMESGHPIRKSSVAYNVTQVSAKPIVVEKTTAKVADILAKFLRADDKKRAISASSLNSYIACPLKFYFAQIAQLTEPQEVEEEVDERMLGNIFHHTIYALYEPHINVCLSENMLQNMLQNRQKTAALVEQFTAKEFFNDEKKVAEIQHNGKLLMVTETVVKYVEGTLRYDMAHAPFTIAGLEKRLDSCLPAHIGSREHVVNFKGYIDRMDVANGGVRIIDYKTGSSRNGMKLKMVPVEALFSAKEKERRPEIFQALLYSSIIHKAEEGAAAITPMLFFVRDLCKDDGSKNAAILDDVAPLLPDFNELLCAKLSELFDASKPFVQAEDTATCKYCLYSKICHR